MARATIVIETTRSVEHLVQELDVRNDNKKVGINRIVNLLAGMNGGAKSGKVQMQIEDGGDAASVDITCAQASASAGDTITIAGVVFTVAASPSASPADGEFAAGSTNAELAENLAAAVAAHPRLKGAFTAASASAVATVTNAVSGVHGNAVSVATSNTDAFSFTGFADGTAGTVEAHARAYLCGVE